MFDAFENFGDEWVERIEPAPKAEWLLIKSIDLFDWKLDSEEAKLTSSSIIN